MLVQDAVFFFCTQATSVGEQAGATSKQQTHFVLWTKVTVIHAQIQLPCTKWRYEQVSGFTVSL